MADSISDWVKDFLIFERLKQEEPFDLNITTYTTSPEAYINFIHATKLVFNSTDWRDALRYFEKAVEIACSGDVVLLSPGCTSYDAFRDFEERGNFFKKWVNELE